MAEHNTPQTPPATGPQIDVKLTLDPGKRLLSISAKHRLAIEGIDFGLSFAQIKSIAAQILAMESSAEMKSASRPHLLRS